MNKKIVYVDMDGVIADFKTFSDNIPIDELKKYDTLNENGILKHNPDKYPNIFSKLKPIEGAIEGVKKLMTQYDVYILTSSPWDNNTAASEKIEWVKKYFGDLLKKRVIISHNKQLCIGDYLIDDTKRNGADKFIGEHIWFGYDYKNWDEVLKYLMK